jgi:hypothetical protein
MLQNYILSLSKNVNNYRSSAAVIAAALTTTAGAAWYKNTTRCESIRNPQRRKSQKGKDDAFDEDSNQSFRIESHLMDRIQQKQYLSDAKDGIPSTFRVLAIDVPEMRTEAFTGTCVISHSKVFLDDVAPAKAIDVVLDDKGKNNERKLKIAQKSLIKSIVHCSSPQSQQHIGVELLEASVSNLNRFKVRRKQSFGNYTYDPGKYYDADSKNVNENDNNNDDDEMDEIDEGQIPLDKERSDEIEAPWNQYAWMEELRLRINGHIEFDAPVEKSPRYQRVLYGNNYKTTIPAVYKVWDLFMPFSFARSDPNGIDGRNQANVRACNKPHAVIANGAALQLVPSSLRLLQKYCKKADIPLFVVHDPRQWGGNTQASLQEALVVMRSTVKNRIIGNALKQQGSSAFTRGRVLGQVETEAKWQLKDKAKRTRELLGIGGGRQRKAEKEDWSVHDTDTLENKLIERKVIRMENSGNDDNERRKVYSPEMTEISKECIKSQEEKNDEHQDSYPSEKLQ